MKTFKEQMKKLTNILDANNIKHQEDEDYSCVSILGKKDYDITYNTNPNYLKGVGYYVTYVAPNGNEGTPIFAKTFEFLLDILYRKGIIKSKATASAYRKFKFKDGSIITASTAEEAKAKHKVMAADNEAQDASKVKDSIKKVLSSLGLSYTEDNLGDFSVKTIFGEVKIDFYENRNNIKVRWSKIFSKIYGEEDDDVSYSLKISDSNSASKIKEMLVDILKLAELNEKVTKKYASSAPSGL